MSAFVRWLKSSCRISHGKYRQSPSSTCGLLTDVTWPRSPVWHDRHISQYTHMPAYFIMVVQHFFNIHQPKQHILPYVVPDGDYNGPPNNDSFKKKIHICKIEFWRMCASNSSGDFYICQRILETKYSTFVYLSFKQSCQPFPALYIL